MISNQRSLPFVLVLFIVIGIIWVQQLSQFYSSPELKGYYILKPDTNITISNWWSEEYQKIKSVYLNDHVAFRPELVRLHNQLLFTFFHKAHTNHIIVGKEYYLFEKPYVDEYTGKKSIKEDSLKFKIKALKTISDSIAKHGGKLLLILAPGKARYFSEYLPDNYKSGKEKTSHFRILKELQNKQINFIDFNSWFLSIKDTSKYPLYPKTGTHWSNYATGIVADSIAGYIAEMYHQHRPTVNNSNFIYSNVIRDSIDIDIESSMNLIWDPDRYNLAYRDVHWSEVGYKPSCIIISDSYWWQFYNAGYPNDLFSKYQFFYYFKQVYKDYQPGEALDMNYAFNEIKKTDLIIILVAEANYSRLDFGFSEAMLQMYSGKTSTKETQITEYIQKMQNDPEWLDQLRIKAKDQNRTLEDIMLSDANWLYEQEEMKAGK